MQFTANLLLLDNISDIIGILALRYNAFIALHRRHWAFADEAA